LWQWPHGWATLEFLRAMQAAAPSNPPLEFLRQQLIVMSPLAVPLWIAGLVFGLGSPRWRPAFVIWIVTFLFLLTSGKAQIYYVGPAYALLLGAGAVAVERFAAGRGWRWLPRLATALLAAGALAVAPLVVDLLPADLLARDATDATDHYASELPPQFALRFGWAELAQAVAAAYAGLSESERSRAGILVNSFSEAGAVNFFGRRLGLPPAVSPHNNYWLWGSNGYTGEVMIVVADDDRRRIAHHERPDDYRRAGAPVALDELFSSVERVGRVECRYCSNFLRRKSVFVCRDMRQPLATLWPALKEFI
jgi:hypothetical protein